MPKFKYEAMDAQGQEVKAEIDALSSEEAISKIRNLGYFPTKINEKGGRRVSRKDETAAAAGPKKVRGTGGKVKVTVLTDFTRQLSTLQDAGLPILRSLRILESQQKPGTLKSVVRAVANDVEGGATLSEAMAKYPKTFNPLFTNMIAAGETGGVLDLILNRLADFMEKAARLKAKVISAMMYPMAVLGIAFSIVMGIMYFVVPKFEKIFGEFGVTLPVPTQILLDMGTWISEKYGFIYIIGSPVAIILLVRLIRMSPAGRMALDKTVLMVPVVGQIVGKTAVARFTRTLGTLISAGVPILDALNITKDTAGNEVYRRALGSVHESIRKGESFAEPLRKSRVVDGLVVNMVDVGEETGDLDKMLEKISDNYDEQVDRLVTSLVSLLEPVLVISLGVTCGFIVIALFMPMIKMIETLSG